MKKILFISNLLLVLALVGGCAPSTVKELRSNHAGRDSFVVDQNYQPVYRFLLDKMREEYEIGLITAQWVVHGNLYTDIQSGVISHALHGALGVDTYRAIDIEALSDSKTQITTYSHFGQKDAEHTRKWMQAKGG